MATSFLVDSTSIGTRHHVLELEIEPLFLFSSLLLYDR